MYVSLKIYELHSSLRASVHAAVYKTEEDFHGANQTIFNEVYI